MSSKSKLRNALNAIDDAKRALQQARNDSGANGEYQIRRAMRELDDAEQDIQRAIRELPEE